MKSLPVSILNTSPLAAEKEAPFSVSHPQVKGPFFLPAGGTDWFSAASFRSIVLPKEHGSWSLALEPVALGLLVAPSGAGAALAAAVVAGFFLRRPLKLALTLPDDDLRHGAALGWTLACLAPAVAALGHSLTAGTWTAHWPLLLCLPSGAAFLWFDWRGEARTTAAELAGCVTFALIPAALALLAGWSDAAALGLAALTLTRSLPTLLTVRSGLRRAKGQPAQAGAALATATVGALVTAFLAARALIPAASVFLTAALLLRTAFFLSPLRPDWTAKRIGLFEAGLGVLYLTGLAVAYSLG